MLLELMGLSTRIGPNKISEIGEVKGVDSMREFSPTLLREQDFDQLMRGPFMVSLSERTRESYAKCTPHAHSARAHSHFAFIRV